MFAGRWMIPLLATSLLIGATAARAQEDIPALLQRAERAAAAEDWTTAFTALEAASLEVFARMPLTVRNVTFVTAEPKGYGAYEPRPDSVFRPGEPLLVYLEPLGYAFERAEDGTLSYGFAADVAILSADGRVLGGQRDFGKWQFRTRSPATASFVSLRLDLEGLPAGDYQLAVRIRDAGSDETAEAMLPFTVRGE